MTKIMMMSNFFSLNKYLPLLFGLALTITACTPPANWKQSAYIRSEKRAAVDVIPEKTGKNTIIRVKIHEGKAQPIICASAQNDEYQFKTAENQVQSGGGSFVPTQGGILTLKRNYFKFHDKVYTGQLKILQSGGQFTYINLVDIDEYLMSVVGHEMSPLWPQQALRAQAVVARTYLFQKMSENKETDYDVESSTNHQVYKGVVKTGRDNVLNAVLSTKGEIVTYNGKLAVVYYHASAGGLTAAADEVWSKEFPYLRSVKEPFAHGENSHPWEVEVSLSELRSKLKIKTLRGIKVKSRSASQRVETVEIHADGKTQIIKGSEFRNLLGNTKVKSTMFQLKISQNKLIVSGKGYGHGVGMSQWGARYMAEKGKADYKSIIKHFFPGTRIDNS